MICFDTPSFDEPIPYESLGLTYTPIDLNIASSLHTFLLAVTKCSAGDAPGQKGDPGCRSASGSNLLSLLGSLIKEG